MGAEFKQQVFSPWSPIDNLQDKLTIEGIHHDWEGFRILLRPADPTRRPLRLSFESAVGYRNINESYRIRTWGLGFPRSESGLYIVHHSQWVEFLIAEAGGLLDHARERLVHYAVYTIEDCIDIATEFPPEVEWL